MRLQLVLKIFLLLISTIPMAWADQTLPGYAPPAQTVAAPTASNSTTGAAAPFQAISSQDFLRRVGNALVVHYCDPQSPLLSDFHLTVAQCQTQMSAIQAQCTQTVQPKMPAVVSDSTTAGQWGQALGQCMGQTFVQSQQTAVPAPPPSNN